MSCKSPLLGNKAVGFWGRNPKTTFDAEQIPDKVLAQNLDMVRTMGLPYSIWRSAGSQITNPARCSCWKATAKQADIPCLSCYGTGYLPGYLKFGTRNYWYSSIDSWTLTNMVLDKTNRPYRLMLDPAALSGSAESPDIAVALTGKLGSWEARTEGFSRDNNVDGFIFTDISVDSGVTWVDISLINTLTFAGVIRFRIRMVRSYLSVKSPMFEMVRVRFPTMLDPWGTMTEPVVRLIPTWDVESHMRMNYGERVDTSGKRFWTVPLNFFDGALQAEVFASRLGDDAFAECRYGGEIGFRYDMIQFKYSDTFSKFTRQEMELRRVAGDPSTQDGEGYMRIF